MPMITLDCWKFPYTNHRRDWLTIQEHPLHLQQKSDQMRGSYINQCIYIPTPTCKGCYQSNANSSSISTKGGTGTWRLESKTNQKSNQGIASSSPKNEQGEVHSVHTDGCRIQVAQEAIKPNHPERRMGPHLSIRDRPYNLQRLPTQNDSRQQQSSSTGTDLFTQQTQQTPARINYNQRKRKD